ncbi:MAG TPA: GNAT family N-acetyltransferase [Firmicutes bacterium]|nr:GNAT family N-acetyltransferase [Bacillota bacterium]
MEVAIVPIAEEHVMAFHSCLDVVARERCYLGFLAAPPLESMRRFVRANIENGHVQLVALADGTLLGWCDILPHDKPGFTHCGSLGMGVHPDHRRRGIGKRLITEALHRARKQGIERVELEVFASNPAARALYEQMGFVVEGVKRRARKLDGRYEDIVLMALFLSDGE